MVNGYFFADQLRVAAVVVSFAPREVLQRVEGPLQAPLDVQNFLVVVVCVRLGDL